TFRTEIEIDNPGGTIPAGVSAEATIPIARVDAHFVSPAVLVLDEAGVLGVKTVDAANRAQFQPVTIVSATPEGLWVAGLPETVRLITVGHGFVAVGETVRVSLGDPPPAPPAI